MILGYNTNGLANHDPVQALELLNETGYQCLGLTLDHLWLNPFSSDYQRQKLRLVPTIHRLELTTVIETGARFLLDPRRKHFPSLVAESDEALPRIRLIEKACQLAAELESRCVSLWSGYRNPAHDLQTAWDLLAKNLEHCLKVADTYGVVLGLEPEPGMFIDTVAAFERLQQWVAHPRLALTLDLGHLFCMGELPIADYIRRVRSFIVNVHIEDMNPGVHEHLMFGEGSMSFPPIIEALAGCGYQGPLVVELSRHSHVAPIALREAFEFLSPLIQKYCPNKT